MTTELINEVPFGDLPDLVGVARSQIYNRRDALIAAGYEFNFRKEKNKLYISGQDLQTMQEMHRLISVEKKTIDEAVLILVGQSSQHIVPQNPSAGIEESPTGFMQMFVRAIAQIVRSEGAIAPAPSDPLQKYRQLQEIAEQGWQVNSSELASILGLKRLSGSAFERYGYRFERVGRNGAESAWLVTKL
jgi:hypothetical protein